MLVEINESEVWVLIDYHQRNEERHAGKKQYADASDEKNRADYLRSLVQPK